MTSKAKYLGVTLDSKIFLGPHVSNTTWKSNNTIAFLRRETSYEKLVRPQLEYAATVWDNTIETPALEAVQGRAARYITGDYSVTCATT